MAFRDGVAYEIVNVRRTVCVRAMSFTFRERHNGHSDDFYAQFILRIGPYRYLHIYARVHPGSVPFPRLHARHPVAAMTLRRLLGKNLRTVVSLVKRLSQRSSRDSTPVHRLPLEILAVVASHLDEKSLIIATHVCLRWRSALISSPRLWSHLTSKNNQRMSLFLERSKLAPISVDLDIDGTLSEGIGESLERVADRLTTLHVQFQDELPTQPLLILRNLDAATTTPGHPMFPRLTDFRLQLCPGFETIPKLGDNLLDFLRNCPLLEVAFFDYDGLYSDIEFTTSEESTKAVSLPHLRSFTHESLNDRIDIGLFNRLSLPTTCDLTFTITDHPRKVDDPWDCGFPTLHGPSYFTDADRVEIAAITRNDGNVVVRTKFLNSENRSISLNRLTLATHESCSASGVQSILDFLGSCEMARSVETLDLQCCPVSRLEGYPHPDLAGQLLRLDNLKTLVLWECNPIFFLGNLSPPEVWCPRVENLVIFLPLSTDPRKLLKRVKDIAASRKKHGNALKTVSLCFQEDQWVLRMCRRVVAELRRCVGLVEII